MYEGKYVAESNINLQSVSSGHGSVVSVCFPEVQGWYGRNYFLGFLPSCCQLVYIFHYQEPTLYWEYTIVCPAGK